MFVTIAQVVMMVAQRDQRIMATHPPGSLERGAWDRLKVLLPKALELAILGDARANIEEIASPDVLQFFEEFRHEYENVASIMAEMSS
jgi:hypothetical protein